MTNGIFSSTLFGLCRLLYSAINMKGKGAWIFYKHKCRVRLFNISIALIAVSFYSHPLFSSLASEVDHVRDVNNCGSHNSWAASGQASIPSISEAKCLGRGCFRLTRGTVTSVWTDQRACHKAHCLQHPRQMRGAPAWEAPHRLQHRKAVKGRLFMKEAKIPLAKVPITTGLPVGHHQRRDASGGGLMKAVKVLLSSGEIYPNLISPVIPLLPQSQRWTNFPHTALYTE